MDTLKTFQPGSAPMSGRATIDLDATVVMRRWTFFSLFSSVPYRRGGWCGVPASPKHRSENFPGI